ncbi:MAG: hypothetical protein ACSW8A_09305 [Lachnospiraceae bacterium]
MVDEMPFLEDVLKGGIYGSSSEDRLHSANITLGTVEAERTGIGSDAITHKPFS